MKLQSQYRKFGQLQISQQTHPAETFAIAEKNVSDQMTKATAAASLQRRKDSV